MAVTMSEIITDIKNNIKQVSASQKDEVRVMQGMLNDTSFEVGVYGNAGQTDTYNPAKDFRSMQSAIVSSVAKISKDEASVLVDGYEVTKSDASTMVNISKEFVNTYLSTGRKLPFGGREDSDYALSMKEIPETEKTYQMRITDASGNVSYQPEKKIIPAHKGLKAKSSCPKWVK